MGSHSLKARSRWRRRREDYLRATGRYDDLIREGYEPAIQVGKWSVIRGGRARRSRETTRGPELVLVKGIAS